MNQFTYHDMFPGADFSGFWICHSKQNSRSNDTPYVKVTISSGSKPLTPPLIVITTYNRFGMGGGGGILRSKAALIFLYHTYI